MHREFTAAQQAAIDCNAQSVLVSAAAGSGKTAVLTERILRHVSQGRNIDQLLVVTFTEASTQEMRERIADELEKRGLAYQIAILPTADISTIHAFCRKLVKEHFQMLDIDPAFRVGDDAELSIIRQQVMTELFEDEYAREENADFTDLVDTYGGKTDGRLDALVRKIHHFMESDPYPAEAALRYAGNFDVQGIDLNETPWADVVIEEILLGIDGILEGIKQGIAICNMPAGPDKYADTFQEDYEKIDALRSCVLGGNFAEMYVQFSAIAWRKLSPIGKKDEVDLDLKNRVTRIRNNAVKKKIKDLQEGVFFAPPEKMQMDLCALFPRMTALMDLVRKFTERYSIEKRTRNILDFSDLEHFAIQILYKDGQPSAESLALKQQYYEVMIDEYQDSNLIQDMILSAVAGRQFMVGDVKQSIYRFRLANPGIFLEKYNQYELGGADAARIDLSHNFRSRPEVLDAVNFFFSQLMCSNVGDVVYDDAAALHAGRKEYPAIGVESPAMWVEILDEGQDTDTLEYIEGNDDAHRFENSADTDSSEEELSAVAAETRMLAKIIRELIATRKISDEGVLRPCRLGDIAILTRSFNSMASQIVEELKVHDIDAIAEINAGFFEQQEVQTALAFLKITDNPRQDNPLITVLYSSAYQFTPDELIEISWVKIAGDNTLFYDKLVAFAGDSSLNSNLLVDGELLAKPSISLVQKVHKFLSDLEKWRTQSIHLPISRLISLIYDTTKYPSYVAAMQGGDIRQANLRMLMERAIQFEETSLKGLFHFVQYIKRLSDSDAKGESGAVESGKNYENSVRIMSIHKSKGLEFPIVICGFLGKKFNTEDERQPVILHSQLGIGSYYVDLDLRTRANTLARFSLSKLGRRENLSEELRCLYVAMTRAKDLLILTGRTKDFAKSLEKWADYMNSDGLTLPIFYRRSVNNYLDWLMPCLLRHRDAAGLLDSRLFQAGNKNLWAHAAHFKVRTNTVVSLAETLAHSPVFSDDGLLQNEPAFLRPNTQQDYFDEQANNMPQHTSSIITLQPLTEVLSVIPSKLSITEIKRLYDLTPDSTPQKESAPNFDQPGFIKSKQPLTSMQLGSILHKITEHIHYNVHITLEAIDALIADLAIKNILTQEESAAANRFAILTLVNAEVAERIRNAKSVHREVPFILALPAEEIYPEVLDTQQKHKKSEKILIHGTIDCYFEEENKQGETQITLLDFKSDAWPQNMTSEKWSSPHITQLKIYKKAIIQATGIEKIETLLYSFAKGITVPVLQT